MDLYKNLSRTSGVAKYQIAPEAITVEFNDGAMYEYDYRSAGDRNVEEMKRLAVRGLGLNSFINLYVKKGYARKIR